MTIDEAIAHCLEVAEQNEISAITYKNCKEIKVNMYEKLTAEKAENDCRECAADHRQLAEWLTELKELEAKHWDECRQIAHYDDELKEAKRLLNEAVLAFRIMGEDIDCHFNYLCEKCPLNNNNDWCEWKYQAEALKLIGGSEND